MKPLPPIPSPTPRPQRFIDLFAGIGGFRLGFEAAGAVCVWSSEIDPQARKVYAVNHEGAVGGDIREQDACDIPPHDLLLAGFPCQPFSIGGKRKGRKDPRGTLFDEILRVLEHGQTEGFVLENVRGLASIDGGATLWDMSMALKDLGFHVGVRFINSVGWLPQKRERLFITGHRSNRAFNLDFFRDPDPASGPKLGSILEREGPDTEDCAISSGTWEALQAHRARHEAAGNGFGFGLVGAGDVGRTLSARYAKDVSEILVRPDPFAETRISDEGMAAIEKHAKERRYKVHACGPDDVGNTLTASYKGSTGASAVLVAGEGRNPRRLTPRECARYMGFPDSFEIPVAKQHAYRLFGNAVCPPVAEAIARHLFEQLEMAGRYAAFQT